MAVSLSAAEREALRLLQRRRSILVTEIPEHNERTCFGDILPGRAVFRKLEARGLCFETIEDAIFEEGGETWTPTLEITQAGDSVSLVPQRSMQGPSR